LALKIANTMHTRVAGLAMIIRFETVQVLEYYAEEVDGKYFEEKRFSKIIIKLTKCPTEDDRK
jgi:trehalose-6-phosphatase